MLSHICRCYASFQDRTKIYVVWHPAYTHHFGIIDSSHIVSEYYKYNLAGDLLPELLFVEEVSSSKEDNRYKLLKKYQTDIQEIIQSRNLSVEINLIMLQNACREAYKKLILDINTANSSDSDWVEKGYKLDLLASKKEQLITKLLIVKHHFPDFNLPDSINDKTISDKLKTIRDMESH